MSETDLISRNFGTSPTWDDLRVPVNATIEGGSSPPSWALIKDTGVVGEGYALFFDGVDDYATIPHADSGSTDVFDFAATWSTAFWARIPANVGNNEYIFYHPSWSIRTRPNGVLRIELDSKTPVDTSSNSYLAGQRNHFVLVIEEGATTNIKFYINNILEVDQTLAGALEADGGEDIAVGYNGSTGFLEMTLDNVRFYDIALSTANVASLYASGEGTESAVEDSNTVSFYKLNEGTGAEAADEKYAGATTHIMALAGPIWDDNLVELAGATHGVYGYHFSPDVEQELFFTVQLPHAWIQYASIEPHIHWSAATAAEGNVVWGLEYTWANVAEIFGNTTVVTVTDATEGAYKHQIADFEYLAGADKTLSSMILCRVYRKAEDEEDTYTGQAILLEIDFHYESFGVGSKEEYH